MLDPVREDLCAWLPSGIDDRAVERGLAGAAIAAGAPSPQALTPLARDGRQPGFTAFSPARLRESAAALRVALTPLLRGARR